MHVVSGFQGVARPVLSPANHPSRYLVETVARRKEIFESQEGAPHVGSLQRSRHEDWHTRAVGVPPVFVDDSEALFSSFDRR